MNIVISTLRNIRLFKIPFLLLAFSIFVVGKCRAQEQNLPSRFLTVKDGLPQGFISGIAQDKAGFIWISTRNGLARYDGKKFKVFYHNLNDTTSIAGNIISNIFLDSRNRLWIKYESAGLDIFYPETERIYHISNQPGLEVLKNVETEIDGLYEDVNQGLLLNTLKHGIIQLGIDDHPPLKYFLKRIMSTDEKIFGITQDKAHHLFILTKNFLYRLNERQELVSKTPFSVPASIDRNIQNRYGMFFPSDSVLFISGSNGIVKYDVRDNHFFINSISPVIKTLWGANKYSLLYPNGKEGVLNFTNSSISYTFSTNASANITSLLDKTNVLWIGTSGYGIQLVHLRHNSFQYKKYTPPFTTYVAEKYLGVDGDKIPKSLATVDKNNIYSLRWTYDKTGKLWMCNGDTTGRLGMQVWGYNNKRFSRPDWHYTSGEKIKKDVGWGIAADSKNNLWILSGAYNLHKLNPSSGIVQSFSPSLPQHIIHGEEALLIDKQDNFWISSDYGLLHYREGWKGYVCHSLNRKNIFDIESNRTINIAEDLNDENNLWMGSLGNGLICFNKIQEKFTSYTKKDGLPDNTIYSVMADINGYLWCTTNQGIFRFDTRTKKARKYTSDDGAPDFEFNRFHHLRLPDGRLVFGGFNDYTVFDPLSLQDDTSQPNVAIVSWKVNNKPADYREEGSLLSQSVNSLNELHLNYFQNFLSFEFAALQYNQPEIFEHRYKLSGIDKDWVYAGNSNTASYTALPAGSYTLSINAANAAGSWSNKVKEFKIMIDPPWWKTWWAYLMYALIAGAIIFLVFRNRLRQLHLQQEVILKQKETAQMKQLDELKNRFFSNITHELRTPLSLIISPVEKQLHENGEKYSSKVLKGVQQNAKQLLKLINQLLDMSKLEAGSMQLSLSRGKLVMFIEQLMSAFKPNAEEKHIQLLIKAEEAGGEYIFDSDKVEKIINNLLSNAFKFTPNGGSISIEMSVTKTNTFNHLIQIIVTDTGIGIAAESLPNIFNRFYQADNSSTRKYEGTGIGLSLVQELVKLMNGNIKAESEERKGSSFTVTLPLQPATHESNAPQMNQPPVEPAQNELSPSFSAGASSPLILVTDDNKELREFITECLQSNYRIITASNGAEGLQQAQNEIPDVIISDVMMPVMDGYEFCEKVKQSKATNHTAFIMLTAKAALESKISGLRLGADDYLTKPFNAEELLLRVSNLLKRQEKLRDFYRGQLQHDTPVPVINEVQNAFLQSVYEVIEKNLDNENLNVEMLATEVAVSRRTLDRKLSSIAGMSANEIIRNYRLKKAEELLLQGYNVTETAYRTGFSTPSWFTKSFKEMYGETPLVYTENRKSSQN